MKEKASKMLKYKIQSIIDYIDKTIEEKNATEPNALAIRNMLIKALTEE